MTKLRRSSRAIRPPKRYSFALHYILLTNKCELETYKEALQADESTKWELAIKDEMDSLMSNQTWQLAELPRGKKALHNEWVYRIKEEHDGNKRYKARLVVKGFQQIEGIDYTEFLSSSEAKHYQNCTWASGKGKLAFGAIRCQDGISSW